MNGPGRIRLGRASLSISRFGFLADGAGAELRDFLERAFSLDEVRSVDLDRRVAKGLVRFDARSDLPQFLRRLGRALRLGDDASGSAGVGPRPSFDRRCCRELFLDAPGPLRVSRIGRSLSTFRIRIEAPDRFRLAHPLLSSRPDMRLRLAEELAALPEVSSARPDRLAAAVVVRTGDRGDQAIERVVREVELAWPRLLDGFEAPPSARPLAISAGLLALSTVGTLYAPALLPVAVAGVVLNGLPNAIRAIADLVRGRIGVRALQATGLVFFLLTRSPLSSTLMATVTHLWPKLANDLAIARQRQLLAPYRGRPRFAWLVLADGSVLEGRADSLQAGDLFVVRRGERVAADGTIERGLVATVDLIAGTEATDKEPGDAIRAGERVLDGEAFVRVGRPADRSTAALIDGQLPHGLFPRLPSIGEAERIADRNAKPALAVAIYALGARRGLRPARAVIRPDYATAARLSAQLGAQEAFVDALRSGVLFRRPAAIERLARAEVLVLDDSAPLTERPIEIGRIVTNGLLDAELLAHAAPVFDAAILGRDGTDARGGKRIRRRAGCAWYEDPSGHRIEVASEAYLNGVDATRPGASVLRSIWVLRDGERLGRIDFRHGAPRAAHARIAALRATLPPSVKFVHLSVGTAAAAAELGAVLGVDVAVGGLDANGKAEFIRDLGRRAAWVGDGTASAAGPAIAASDVSLSTAPPSDEEQADALLLRGLEGIAVAWTAAQAYRAVIAGDYRLVYAANLAAALGGLTSGFSSLHAGLLSNAATAVVYARHVRRLRLMARRQERDWAPGAGYAR